MVQFKGQPSVGVGRICVPAQANSLSAPFLFVCHMCTLDNIVTAWVDGSTNCGCSSF